MFQEIQMKHFNIMPHQRITTFCAFSHRRMCVCGKVIIKFLIPVLQQPGNMNFAIKYLFTQLCNRGTDKKESGHLSSLAFSSFEYRQKSLHEKFASEDADKCLYTKIHSKFMVVLYLGF